MDYYTHMKEKYIPVEPVKKGIEVTSIGGKLIYEAVKPRVEQKMKRSVAELFDILLGSK